MRWRGRLEAAYASVRAAQPAHQNQIHRTIGILCGAGAAMFWAVGFTAARHGIDIGFSPADITFHRCVWAGVLLLPLFLRGSVADLNGIGWGAASRSRSSAAPAFPSSAIPASCWCRSPTAA